MRLRHLELVRYGKFTDHPIDFGLRSDQIDFHLMYGPNEAGKTTARQAYLDLLFGIGTNNAYRFKHQETMQLGAEFELTDQTIAVTRVSGRGVTLFDKASQPISESILQPVLKGLSRSSYEAMFVLNEEVLENGGETILSSEGDLGQLLFSASAGLSELYPRLQKLRDETDAIYRARSSKGQIHEIKRQLEEKKAERESINLRHDQFSKLIKERDSANANYLSALSRLREFRHEYRRLQDFLDALPLWEKRQAAALESQALEHLPVAPRFWHEEIGPLQKRYLILRTQMCDLQQRVADINHALGENAVDDIGLQLGRELQNLQELRAQYLTAQQDLPKRLQEDEALKDKIIALQQRLSSEPVERLEELVIDPVRQAALAELIASHSGREAEKKSATQYFHAKQEAFEALSLHAHSEEKRATAEQVSLAERWLQRYGPGEIYYQAAKAEENWIEAQEQWRLALLELWPWKGDRDMLLAFPQPSQAELLNWQNRLAEFQSCQSSMLQLAERLKQDLARQTIEIDQLNNQQNLVKDELLRQLRIERDHAFEQHRHKMDSHSLKIFALALQRYDQVIETSMAQNSVLEQLKQMEAAKKRQTQELHFAKITLENAKQDELELLACVKQQSQGLFEQPTRWTDWLTKRDKALAIAERMHISKGEYHRAKSLCENAVSELIVLAGQFNVARHGSLPDSAEALRIWLDRQRTALEHDRQLAKSEIELANAEKQALASRQAMEEWEQQWRFHSCGTWLETLADTLLPAQMAHILKLTDQLSAALELAKNLGHRIETMRNNQAVYDHRLRQLALKMQWHSEGVPTAHLAEKLEERAKTAQQGLVLRNQQRDDLQRLTNQISRLEEKIAEDRTIIEKMLAHFSVESLEEVEQGLLLLRQRENLQQQITELTQSLQEIMSFDQAQAVLPELKREELRLRRADIETLILQWEESSRESLSQLRLKEAEILAIGSDSAIAELDEKRALLLVDLEQYSLRYLQMRAGILAVEEGLHLYRQQHRSSMLLRAEEAFVTLTGGAYSNLVTHLDNKGQEILLALTPDGTTKVAQTLSKATRFQLYLALRIAGYYEYALQSEPPPLVADDILESFDDQRASATLKLLGKMSGKGQVIYFTHHQHLIDLARSVVPEVKVHYLV